MSNIVLLTYGRNAYDHSVDVEHDNYYGSFKDDPARQRVYIQRAEQYMTRGDTGWYSIIEVDTITGETLVWFLQKNPLKTRVELNIPAKEAQAMRKVKRIAIPSSISDLLGEISSLTPVGWPTPSSASLVAHDGNDDNDSVEPEF